MACVAFSIKLRKQIRQLPKIMNLEICENYSLLFIFIHSCPYAGPSRPGDPVRSVAVGRGARDRAHVPAPERYADWPGRPMRGGVDQI